MARQWRKSKGKNREERRKGQGRKKMSKERERMEGNWKATHTGIEGNNLEYNYLKRVNLTRSPCPGAFWRDRAKKIARKCAQLECPHTKQRFIKEAHDKRREAKTA